MYQEEEYDPNMTPGLPQWFGDNDYDALFKISAPTEICPPIEDFQSATLPPPPFYSEFDELIANNPQLFGSVQETPVPPETRPMFETQKEPPTLSIAKHVACAAQEVASAAKHVACAAQEVASAAKHIAIASTTMLEDDMQMFGSTACIPKRSRYDDEDERKTKVSRPIDIYIAVSECDPEEVKYQLKRGCDLSKRNVTFLTKIEHIFDQRTKKSIPTAIEVQYDGRPLEIVLRRLAYSRNAKEVETCFEIFKLIIESWKNFDSVESTFAADCMMDLANEAGFRAQSGEGDALPAIDMKGFADLIAEKFKFDILAYQDAFGNNLIHTAVSRHANPNMIEPLIRAGADINALNSKSRTPLFATLVRTGHNRHECFTELLENGADPNIPNREGVTPLEYALSIKHCRFCKELVERGAKIGNAEYIAAANDEKNNWAAKYVVRNAQKRNKKGALRFLFGTGDGPQSLLDKNLSTYICTLAVRADHWNVQVF